LNEDQEEISQLFASHSLEKFNKIFTGYLDNVPYIKGGTVLLCELYSNQSIFDHVIFTGKVKDLIIGNKKPLIYWNRKYMRIK
ncbi:MAG: flavin reductase, partial [Nitrososphaeria archaeon]